MKSSRRYGAIVIGCSAGGLRVLIPLFEKLPVDYNIPIILVQHRSKDERELLEEVLQQRCLIRVIQASEKESITNGCVHIAPADYHLLIEKDMTFSLTSDEKVNYARPSIDILFETAAEVYTNKLIGIILTGANSDGAGGIKTIRRFGGLTIAQEPKEAEYPAMPQAAIKSGAVDKILTVIEIKNFLLNQACE